MDKQIQPTLVVVPQLSSDERLWADAHSGKRKPNLGYEDDQGEYDPVADVARDDDYYRELEERHQTATKLGSTATNGLTLIPGGKL